MPPLSPLAMRLLATAKRGGNSGVKFIEYVTRRIALQMAPGPGREGPRPPPRRAHNDLEPAAAPAASAARPTAPADPAVAGAQSAAAMCKAVVQALPTEPPPLGAGVAPAVAQSAEGAILLPWEPLRRAKGPECGGAAQSAPAAQQPAARAPRAQPQAPPRAALQEPPDALQGLAQDMLPQVGAAPEEAGPTPLRQGVLPAATGAAPVPGRLPPEAPETQWPAAALPAVAPWPAMAPPVAAAPSPLIQRSTSWESLAASDACSSSSDGFETDSYGSYEDSRGLDAQPRVLPGGAPNAALPADARGRSAPGSDSHCLDAETQAPRSGSPANGRQPAAPHADTERDQQQSSAVPTSRNVIEIEFMKAHQECGHCHLKKGAAGVSLKRCMHCRVVHYCSAECQRQDWRLHKLLCSHLLGMEPLLEARRQEEEEKRRRAEMSLVALLARQQWGDKEPGAPRVRR